MIKKQERYQDLNFKKYYDEDFFKIFHKKMTQILVASMPTENAYNKDALLSQSNVYVKLVHMTLFRNKRFVLNETLQNLLYLIYVY